MADTQKAPSTSPVPQTITLDTNQLNDLIATAVAAAMQKQTQASPVPMDLAGLAEAIGRSVAAGIAANKPPEKVSIGQYIRRGAHSPFHPLSYKDTPKMSRHYYQNGSPIIDATTHDDEIKLLNRITHSGRYINRLVEVSVRDEGADEVVYINFSNKTDAMFLLKEHIRNFKDMLEQIVAAQEQESKEADEREERTAERRRHFGNGKNTREAIDRANQ